MCSTSTLFSSPAVQSLLRSSTERYREVEDALASTSASLPASELTRLSVELGKLSKLQSLVDSLHHKRRLLQDALDVIQQAAAGEEELVALAEEERDELLPVVESLEAAILRLVVPPAEHDDRGAVLEVRAGSGGDEAALFAAELVGMYTRYAQSRGWAVESLGVSKTSLNGCKEASLAVKGDLVFQSLKFENGVHRVQRVPVNDVRLHTSTATVFVMPEAEDVDLELRPVDLRVETFRASGAGGQHVNTTDSAVRITHVPTGLTVSMQDERSQHQNRARAMRVLRARLLDRAVAERAAATAQQRSSSVGSGDRSERVRTYNYPQDRVTDHRLQDSFVLSRVVKGELDQLVEAMLGLDQQDRLRELCGGGAG